LLPQFILTDIGTHILDAARFLFGEAAELQCQTRRIHLDIAGEGVATVLMRMQNDSIVVCNMSYASRCESDLFPQTFVSVEGTQAGVSLGANYELRIYDKKGVTSENVAIAETTGQDNLKTLQLIDSTYRSAMEHQTIEID